MSLIVSLSSSPARPSRSAGIADLVGQRVRAAGLAVEALDLRDLPAESLLHARLDDPAILAALQLLDRADGIVVVTPIYKAAYSGLLKVFLDLLPQFGLAGKVALPLATGSVAHVLAIDYALRPLLAALNAQHIVSGLFLLDKLLERQADGSLLVEAQLGNRLQSVVDEFIVAVRARAHVAGSLLPAQHPSSIAAAAPTALPAGPPLAPAEPRARRDGTSPAT